MKKMLAINITLLIIFSGTLGSLLTQTDVYIDVQRKIVEELCLSCIKLKPFTKVEYRFLPDGISHPDFIIENLTKGPILLDYRITFCPGCNDLEEYILSDVFYTEFPNPLADNDNNEVPDLLYLERQFKDTNFTFIHFNTGDTNSLDVPIGGVFDQSREVYDIVGDAGNPMLVFVTYGYNHGFIEPYYCTLYSIGSGNYAGDPEVIKEELVDLINEAVNLYNEHVGAH